MNGLMARRRIAALDRPTPLVIPSFSSIDPHARARLLRVGHYAVDCILVSALDLAAGTIAPDDLLGFETVFVDSGGYEARILRRWAATLRCEAPAWTPRNHDVVLSSLPAGPAYVLVTFDGVENVDLQTQIEAAARFRDGHPDHPVDFLLKPEPGRDHVTLAGLESALDVLDQFDVLGVAEQELGLSLAHRCATVKAFRRRLKEAGVEIPLHLFGCLNPLSMIMYVRCGADIFDGLAWTRHAMHGVVPWHSDAFRILSEDFEASDVGFHEDVDRMNLRVLTEFQAMLRGYVESASLDEFVGLGGWGLPAFRPVAAKWTSVFGGN